MERIETTKIRSIFYKGKTDKPDWEKFFTAEQIASKVTNGKLPTVKSDPAKRHYILNHVRVRLYKIMEQELEYQGRFLVAVKRPREEAVYGFTRERDKIINYIARRAKRDSNIAHRTKEIVKMANTFMKLIEGDSINKEEINQEIEQLKLGYHIE